MWRLAIKDLLGERGRLLISVGGVASALLLVLVLDGVFAGTSEQIVAYPKQTDADVWVMQEGVSNMHMATSIMPGAREQDVRGVAGVSDATPILYVNNFVHAGGREWFSYIVGLQPGARRGGPWSMKAGNRVPKRGELILTAAIAKQTGIGIGETVQVMGRPMRVVGLSNETYSLANSITFVSFEDLAELMAAPNQVSYLLVRSDGRVDSSVLAAAINDKIAGVHAMTREEFIISDREMALQMGTDVIRVMTLVGFAVAVLIIGFTMYTATLRRRRELAVAKALGARNRALLGVTVLQTMLVTAAAFVVAIGLAYAIRPLIHWLVPEVAVIYPTSSIVQLAVAALVSGLVASWVPARGVMRIDPALAFKE